MAIDVWSWDAVLARAETALTGDDSALVTVSVNLDHLFHFGSRGRPVLPTGRHDDYQWLSLLDGRPVAWAVRRRLHDPSAPLLSGSDLLPVFLDLAARHRLRVGLVGGSAQTRSSWPESLRSKHPGAEPVGEWRVDWSWLDRPGAGADLAERVAQADVDVLVVSLGKPRQELWLRDHFAATGARLGLPFGSAADYVADTLRRPPRWATDRGLEWLVRLAREPVRLWRRYLVEAPVGAIQLLRVRG